MTKILTLSFMMIWLLTLFNFALFFCSYNKLIFQNNMLRPWRTWNILSWPFIWLTRTTLVTSPFFSFYSDLDSLYYSPCLQIFVIQQNFSTVKARLNTSSSMRECKRINLLPFRSIDLLLLVEYRCHSSQRLTELIHTRRLPKWSYSLSEGIYRITLLGYITHKHVNL